MSMSVTVGSETRVSIPPRLPPKPLNPPVCAFDHQQWGIIAMHSRVTDPAMSETYQSPRVHIRPISRVSASLSQYFVAESSQTYCSVAERDASFFRTKMGDRGALFKLGAEQWFEP